MSCETFLLCLVCVIFPPAAVGIKYGCGEDFLINCVLTIFGFVPGHIHGFYVLLSRKHQAKVFLRNNNIIRTENGNINISPPPRNNVRVKNYGTPVGDPPSYNNLYPSAPTV